MDSTRFTVTLPSERYAALKETAARQGKTMAEIINESLDLYGVNGRTSALELVAQARRRAGLNEAQAAQMANAETRAQRSGK